MIGRKMRGRIDQKRRRYSINSQKGSNILKDHTPQPSTPIKHAGSVFGIGGRILG
jgi:hypothetical protein